MIFNDLNAIKHVGMQIYRLEAISRK